MEGNKRWGGGEGAPAAALFDNPTLPPTGGGILQHPMSVAFATMLGADAAVKSLVQSMRRKTRSFESSSRTTFACEERQLWHEGQQQQSAGDERAVHRLQGFDEGAVAEDNLGSNAVARVGKKGDSVAKVG